MAGGGVADERADARVQQGRADRGGDDRAIGAKADFSCPFSGRIMPAR